MAAIGKRVGSIHIGTSKETKLDYVFSDSVPEYPSEWFAKHNGVKPSAIVKRYPEDQLTALAESVKGGIKGACLTIETAKSFLYLYAKANMMEELDQDWISFDLMIGQKDARVNPWNIVEIHLGGDLTPTEGRVASSAGAQAVADPASGWPLRSLALYILCVYRLIRVSIKEYEDILVPKLTAQLAAEGGNSMSLSGVSGVYGNWIADRNFLKLVAAYDMFLYRFKDSPDSILRLGSLSSRHRDCAGLLSFGFAQIILDIEAGDLMDWILLKTMGDEMVRMAKEGQETGDVYSYFPYQSDLGLVTRTAYSSNANPYLFLWIHCIGTVLGHKRSENARFNFEGNLADVGLNAVMVSWVFARGGAMTPQFAKDGRLHGDNVEITTGEEGADDHYEGLTPIDRLWLETSGRDPETWFALLKANGYKVPPVVSRVIHDRLRKIGSTREGTVGEYVKSRFLY